MLNDVKSVSFLCGGSNLGPYECKEHDVLLSYTGSPRFIFFFVCGCAVVPIPFEENIPSLLFCFCSFAKGHMTISGWVYC